MTAVEFAGWREEAIESFAHDLARAANRPLDATRTRAAAQFGELLPDGLDTPGCHIMVVHDDGGERVGTIWLGPHQTRSDHGFVYDILIDQHVRGQGFGRAAMLAAEEVLKQDGKTAVGLNVFGFNRTAQSLYESLGYDVVSTQMTKTLT